MGTDKQSRWAKLRALEDSEDALLKRFPMPAEARIQEAQVRYWDARCRYWEAKAKREEHALRNEEREDAQGEGAGDGA